MFLIVLGVIFIIYGKYISFVFNPLQELITFPNRVLFSRDVNLVLSKSVNNEIIKQKDDTIDELSSILDLNIVNSKYEFINSTIISRDSIFWYDKVIIDKGKFSKIKRGMCVIDKNGFIGEVDSTTNNTSTIKLITSPSFNNKISVLINKEYGITTKYDVNKKVLLVDGISNLNDINIGYKVLTSGITSLYPSGILIGNVCGKRKDEYGIEKYIEVALSSSVNTSKYVSVLKK